MNIKIAPSTSLFPSSNVQRVFFNNHPSPCKCDRDRSPAQNPNLRRIHSTKRQRGLNKLRSGLERFSKALFSNGFSEFCLWELSKVANSGTQPSFSLELVDLGIAFWICVQKFGKVCTLCGGNLGILLLFIYLFYSFEFLLLQVLMGLLLIFPVSYASVVRFLLVTGNRRN
jgi:hypothetical protein